MKKKSVKSSVDIFVLLSLNFNLRCKRISGRYVFYFINLCFELFGLVLVIIIIIYFLKEGRVLWQKEMERQAINRWDLLFFCWRRFILQNYFLKFLVLIWICLLKEMIFLRRIDLVLGKKVGDVFWVVCVLRIQQRGKIERMVQKEFSGRSYVFRYGFLQFQNFQAIDFFFQGYWFRYEFFQ